MEDGAKRLALAAAEEEGDEDEEEAPPMGGFDSLLGEAA